MENDLKLINGFSRTPLEAGQVYTFDFILCDNEIDRDTERFSDNALEEICTSFIGVTGVFDHEAKASGQAARIYYAECITENELKNSLGVPYKYVKAKAYMVKTQANSDLIAEIEGGIKKEVSIGCRVDRKVCSICGKVCGECAHKKGENYKEKICHHVLDSVGDAYEWSFVAVPSQKSAGVTKHFSSLSEDEVIKHFSAENSQTVTELARLAIVGKHQLDLMKKDVYKQLVTLCNDESAEKICTLMEKLTFDEISVLKSVITNTAQKRSAVSQFSESYAKKQADNSGFRI